VEPAAAARRARDRRSSAAGAPDAERRTGEFGADHLAGVSIVASVWLREYLAGTLVVLMLAEATRSKRSPSPKRPRSCERWPNGVGDQLGAWYTPMALIIAASAWYWSGDPIRFLSVVRDCDAVSVAHRHWRPCSTRCGPSGRHGC
jgi:hypothetical protein